MRHFPVTLLLALSTAGCVLAQPAALVKLNLHDAEALALQNHPQVLAAQHVVSAMNERIDENRAAYYPGSGRGCYRFAGQSDRRASERDF
jgi:outer membrane protein TolC